MSNFKEVFQHKQEILRNNPDKCRVEVHADGLVTHHTDGAAEAGASVTVLEKASQVGGTTAISGGLAWMPGNRAAVDAGVDEATAASLAADTRLGDLFDEAVAAGAHAICMPHGLGHMMGLDVHDMEDLGEVWVGYDGEPKSTLFGLKSLRLARPLLPRKTREAYRPQLKLAGAVARVEDGDAGRLGGDTGRKPAGEVRRDPPCRMRSMRPDPEPGVRCRDRRFGGGGHHRTRRHRRADPAG